MEEYKMEMYTYQNKAWKILEGKIEQMKKDGDSRAEEFERMMRESASEGIRKSTDTKELAGLLMDGVNSSAFNNEEFAKAVTTSHRTLQQSFMRAIVRTINEWDNLHKENWYDLRNEATVKASSKMVEVVKDDYFPLV
jgi:hypothetical protein